MGHAANSLSSFALVWAAVCVLASALVTSTLLRDTNSDLG